MKTLEPDREATDADLRATVAKLLRRLRHLETRVAYLEGLDVESLDGRVANLECQIADLEDGGDDVAP